MNYLITFTLLLFFIGCAMLPQVAETSVPKLLVQYPLPEPPEAFRTPFHRLEMMLFISEEGAVEKVRFLTFTGSSIWDSLAADAIRKWKFAPAIVENKPAPFWIRVNATLKFEPPAFMDLVEILCKTKSGIDSALVDLKSGKTFGSVASKYSISPTRWIGGNLGRVNINCYSADIKKQLSQLKSGEFTEPLKYGEQYAIFIRLNE